MWYSFTFWMEILFLIKISLTFMRDNEIKYSVKKGILIQGEMGLEIIFVAPAFTSRINNPLGNHNLFKSYSVCLILQCVSSVVGRSGRARVIPTSAALLLLACIKTSNKPDPDHNISLFIPSHIPQAIHDSLSYTYKHVQLVTLKLQTLQLPYTISKQIVKK